MDSKRPRNDITDKIFKHTLNQQTGSRSEAFKRGLMAALAYRSTGIKVNLNCPYKPGTADFEEFCAGADEGHKSWWTHEEKKKLKQKR
ncbi:hypothetical protein [Geobacter sp. AOG2]|uniref:hypothetical protein n=1 Tax=Geobacter sp. AOG2 TaxID=1566347 RepID=UPI001CC5CA76|nr:hypothetical protein [Geobacter sp. AOG2]GFE60296.1 hypothetical protein AOG2_08840 [Geobacter sp. AOG2]